MRRGSDEVHALSMVGMKQFWLGLQWDRLPPKLAPPPSMIVLGAFPDLFGQVHFARIKFGSDTQETQRMWKALPDQAASAETSTTIGSTSVSATGDASRLNRSSVVPFTVSGQGWG